MTLINQIPLILLISLQTSIASTPAVTMNNLPHLTIYPQRDDDAQIRQKSETCFKLFTEISHFCHGQHGNEIENGVTSGLDDKFSRFRLWISSIGVFARDHLSLDYRVREADEVKDLFLDQLGIIECRLLQCMSYSSPFYA